MPLPFSSPVRHPLRTLLPALAALLIGVVPLEAQYFGRNKVQYDRFDFRVLETPHFEVHFYPEMAAAIEDVARMSERWYERFARAFQHEFEERKPLIFYADHPDFQQTNTLRGTISEGTGGVTESLKNRVIMPLAGSYRDTDHVLGHELIHAFQYNIAQSRRGGGLQGLVRLPLWMVEGMAEYLSVGREDSHTSMWLRDAMLRDDLPTIEQMTRETRYFPYRFGQAFWTYVGGTYGDDAVFDLYRRSLRMGWEPALQSLLGISSDTLSAAWHASIKEEFQPLMDGRSAPGEVGTLLLAPSTGGGRQNVAPAVSPDGRMVAFLSEKDLFTVDLYLADATTGEIIRKLRSANSDPHADALRFIDSSGSWSPDGSRFVFVTFANGANEMVIIHTRNGDLDRRIRVKDRGIGELTNPAWSPDGSSIAFTGQSGGITNLYLFDLESEELDQLTDDRHADLQATWSPDGRTLAFVSDRGPETDWDQLVYSEYRIALLDMESRQIRVLDLFGNVKHSNPQFTTDGRGLYFISDQDGFSDIYRTDLATGQIVRVTQVATGVSGITGMSPAMTVARNTGTLVFSVFDGFEFHIYALDSQRATGTTLVAGAQASPDARRLPPAEPRVASRVSQYLTDPATGLEPPGHFQATEAGTYSPGLSLDYVAPPSIGVGADRFGTYVGGGAVAYFSDMLGDRNLALALQAQGTVKDIGGQVVYQNLRDRWNWGAGAARIPYLRLYADYARNPDQSLAYREIRERLFLTQASGLLAYPFSTTRRVEGSLGLTRYSYDREVDLYTLDPSGRFVIDRERTSMEAPEALNLAQGTVALVGDNSFFGFTSPVRGGRYRMELETTVGSLNYQGVLADFRRYFSPHKATTIAFRGMHYGRYGRDATSNRIFPLFLGYETLVRGYSQESVETAECTGGTELLSSSSCGLLDRLIGSKIGVFNAEFRIPVIGTEQFGLLNLPYIPVELLAFADVGMAWGAELADGSGAVSPDLRWTREQNVLGAPVASAGFSSRFNILGMLILEAYYAFPFQRPDKGWHWGFNLAPGW
jgi:Tol biopolymer transport system component